jgi:hypothetical protein
MGTSKNLIFAHTVLMDTEFVRQAFLQKGVFRGTLMCYQVIYRYFLYDYSVDEQVVRFQG